MEMDAIASVVMGGTLLTGGVGNVIGTLFGVMINGTIITILQFNGTLSSWWTRIVVGVLTLIFIGIQSVFYLRNKHSLARPDRFPYGENLSGLGRRVQRTCEVRCTYPSNPFLVSSVSPWCIWAGRTGVRHCEQPVILTPTSELPTFRHGSINHPDALYPDMALISFANST